jgi:hypothetical protein
MSSTRLNSHALALNVSAYLLWASAALLFKQLEHLPAWLYWRSGFSGRYCSAG